MSDDIKIEPGRLIKVTAGDKVVATGRVVEMDEGPGIFSVIMRMPDGRPGTFSIDADHPAMLGELVGFAPVLDDVDLARPSSALERIARAIGEALGSEPVAGADTLRETVIDGFSFDLFDLARAALRALYEEAADLSGDAYRTLISMRGDSETLIAKAVFEKMIDAVLAEADDQAAAGDA